jgi:hypothetical protein
MAFIRWKKNAFGIRQAFLIHAYRDEQGKPKQKTLAYLGKEGEISPERLAELQTQHKDLSIDWARVQAVPHPAPRTEINTLSDQELMRRLRELRRERGINMKVIVSRLTEMGKTTVISHNGPEPLDHGWYSWLERAWEEQHPNPVFARSAADLAPFIRKALT